jgi:hypothetical protein
MSDDAVIYDEVDVGDGAPDTDAQLQDRMAGEDQPWQSESDGRFYDKDSNVIIDPETDEPVRTPERLQELQQQLQAQTPKKVEQKPVEPFSQSFDKFAFGDTGVNVQALDQLAERGRSYSYADELVPKANPGLSGKTEDNTIDPVEAIRKEREIHLQFSTRPFDEMRQALVANGIDPVALESLMKPIIDKHTKSAHDLYQERFENALMERSERLSNEKLSAIDKKEMKMNSKWYISELSKQYFPEHGEAAFYALINGHNEGEGDAKKFVRGPAAVVVDFLAAVSSDGKKFKSQEDVLSYYKDMFQKITSDPSKAKPLFDIAYHYYLGKKFGDAKRQVFDQGKEAAARETDRVQKTVKTRPSTFSPSGGADPYAGLPQFMRDVVGAS